MRDFLRGIGGEYGLSVGEVVRFGIAAWLGDLAGALVSVAKNPKAPPRERMRAAGVIRNRIIPMAMFVGEQEERVGVSWAARRARGRRRKTLEAALRVVAKLKDRREVLAVLEHAEAPHPGSPLAGRGWKMSG